MADEQEFKQGDLVRLVTQEGPLMVVAGESDRKSEDAGVMLACSYWNPITGEFKTTDFTPGLLQLAKKKSLLPKGHTGPK